VPAGLAQRPRLQILAAARTRNRARHQSAKTQFSTVKSAACSPPHEATSTGCCSGGITRTFTRSTCPPWTVRTSALCRSSSGSDDCAASCRKSTPGSCISIRSLSADAICIGLRAVGQVENRPWLIHISTSASTICTASASVFARRKPNDNGLTNSARLDR